jgi:hypothetical protein
LEKTGYIPSGTSISGNLISIHEHLESENKGRGKLVTFATNML